MTENRIDLLPNIRPITQYQYRARLEGREDEKYQTEKMAHVSFIEATNAIWASPQVLVLKSDECWGFCEDFHRLKAVSIKNAYAIPRMDQYIESFGSATAVTILDANERYCQVSISNEDRVKTEFVCNECLYRWLRIALGLMNALAT